MKNNEFAEMRDPARDAFTPVSLKPATRLGRLWEMVTTFRRDHSGNHVHSRALTDIQTRSQKATLEGREYL